MRDQSNIPRVKCNRCQDVLTSDNEFTFVCRCGNLSLNNLHVNTVTRLKSDFSLVDETGIEIPGVEDKGGLIEDKGPCEPSEQSRQLDIDKILLACKEEIQNIERLPSQGRCTYATRHDQLIDLHLLIAAVKGLIQAIERLERLENRLPA